MPVYNNEFSYCSVTNDHDGPRTLLALTLCMLAVTVHSFASQANYRMSVSNETPCTRSLRLRNSSCVIRRFEAAKVNVLSVRVDRALNDRVCISFDL